MHIQHNYCFCIEDKAIAEVVVEFEEPWVAVLEYWRGMIVVGIDGCTAVGGCIEPGIVVEIVILLDIEGAELCVAV